MKLSPGFSDMLRVMGKNFAGLDLQERDFSGQDLTGAVFSGANLTNANFKGSVLVGAMFDDAIVLAADFSNANAQNSVFDRVVAAKGYEILSSDTDELVDGSYASSPSLVANFTATVLAGASLCGGVFGGVSFERGDLTGANFKGAYFLLTEDALQCGWETYHNPTGIDVGESYRGACFKNAILSGIKLHDVDLSLCDFSNANLSGANLEGSHWVGANLSGANFTGALLLKATFGIGNSRDDSFSYGMGAPENTQFGRAILVNADLTGSIYSNFKDKSTRLLQREDLAGAILGNTTLADGTLVLDDKPKST